MNTKVLTTALIMGVIAFFLGWLLFGMVLGQFMTDNTTYYPDLMKMTDMSAAPPVSSMLMMFLANFAMSLLVVWILYKFGSKTFMSGFTNGLIIGLLVALTYDLFFHVMMNLYTTTYLVVDVIVNALFTGLLGGIAATILGRGKATA